MTQRLLVTDGTRSYPLSAVTPKEVDFWLHDSSTYGAQDGALVNTVVDAYKFVPWVYRSVQLRAGALADIPWLVLRQGEELASSEESALPADLPWLRTLKRLLQRTEIALCLWGAAYWFVERNRVRTLGYRYYQPTTIEPQFSAEDGLTGFKRTVGARVYPLSTDDLIYWWLPSVEHELGPGTSPVAAALYAAGTLRNVDAWASNFFQRGAVQLTLLSVDGNPAQPELDRLERWWKRLMAGVKKAYDTVAIRASIHPQVIGSQPKDLALEGLTDDKREDVAVAMGVPLGLLLPPTSGRVDTTGSELYSFYIQTVLPEAEFVEEILNLRIFAPLGLEFRFQSGQVDPIQQHAQASAFAQIAAVQAQLMTREEWRKEADLPEVPIGEFITPTVPPALDQNAQGAAAQQAQNALTGAATSASNPGKVLLLEQPARALDLARWQAKALKALERGKSPNVSFETDSIDPEEQTLLRLALGQADSADAVRAAFDPTKAKKPTLPGLDGSDEQRRTLERRHGKAIVAALARQLDAALPPGTNETNVSGAERRAIDAGQPLRDALYAMLADAALLGADVGRRQTEALMGVGKAMTLPATSAGLAGAADFSLVNAAARQAASDYAYELVGQINETTAKVLQSAIADYISNTLSLEQLKAIVASDFGQARADRITSTEVGRAYASGNIAAWQAGGMIAQRQVSVAMDERVCPECSSYADQIVAMDDSSITIPFHPSCRCWWRPYVATDA